MSISEWEVEELARHLCAIPEDDEETDLDDALYDQFEIDFQSFCLIVKALLPMCVVAKSPLTDNTYRGFGIDGLFLVKEEVTE